MNLDYLMNIRRLLDHVETNMAPVIEKVAEACADCIANDGCWKRINSCKRDK